MNGSVQFNTLLVPVDFSPVSHVLFDQAVQLASGEAPVLIVLHVLDSALVELAVSHALGTREDVLQRMRSEAERQLEEFKQRAGGRVEVDTVVSEGTPFVEILRKASDFAVDAVLLARVGSRGKVEKLLFGSTAEKVVRGCELPVLVLPI